MRNLDSPVWRRICEPVGSMEELAELRKTFAAQPLFAEQLSQFLYAEYLSAHHQANIELNPEMQQAYSAYAHGIADLTKKLFAPIPTTERPKVSL